MDEGFSGFKAMLFGLGAIFLLVSVAPEVSNGQFDPLRISKKQPTDGSGTSGRGKGRLKGGTDTGGTDTSTGGTTDGSTGSTDGTGGTTTNAFYTEATMIPTTDFDVNTALVAAWGSGAIPESSAPDILGAFRFVCGAGQLSYDDPIVYPGQPGKSHLHQFYGNMSANANSTYESLRANGDSTCNSTGLMDGSGNSANRSAYWMPAMFDGKGHVVQPDHVTIYYKRLPSSDSRCHPETNPDAWGICVPIPNGLRFVFGYDMLTGQPPTGGTYFNCDGPGATHGNYRSITEALAYCPVGARIGAIINAPICWDGKRLDSANHRDHVSYRESGKPCPSTHPYVMPRFTLSAWYSIKEGDDLKLWRLASDEMHPELPPGSTFHADYFEAWDPFVKAMWTDGCINKMLNCSGGDLGNGKQLKGASVPIYNGVKSFTIPDSLRLVPIPGGSAMGEH